MPTALTETIFEEIERRIHALQRLRGPWHTNYFRQPLTGHRYWMTSRERSLVFLVDDMHFHRLYFFTLDLAELTSLLRDTRLPGISVTSYLTRQLDPAIDSAFQAAGHIPHAVFRRMSNPALRPYETNAKLNFAVPEDVEELLRRVRTDFDPYTSHPPSREMLDGYVRQQWVLVNRHDRTIKGYLIFQIAGKQVNYNYVWNASDDASDMLFLQGNFYGLMARQGIRSGILWVNEQNLGVIRMNELHGWRFDGLLAQYYVITPKH